MTKHQTEEERRALQREERRKNAAIFVKKIMPELPKENRRKCALMRKGKLLDFFADIGAAMDEGNKRFQDGIFTVIRICKPDRRARFAKGRVGRNAV